MMSACACEHEEIKHTLMPDEKRFCRVCQCPNFSIGSQKCKHKRVFFGSGGFYIFCSACSRYWVATKGPDTNIDYDAGGDGMTTNDFRVSQ